MWFLSYALIWLKSLSLTADSTIVNEYTKNQLKTSQKTTQILTLPKDFWQNRIPWLDLDKDNLSNHELRPMKNAPWEIDNVPNEIKLPDAVINELKQEEYAEENKAHELMMTSWLSKISSWELTDTHLSNFRKAIKSSSIPLNTEAFKTFVLNQSVQPWIGKAPLKIKDLPAHYISFEDIHRKIQDFLESYMSIVYGTDDALEWWTHFVYESLEIQKPRYQVLIDTRLEWISSGAITSSQVERYEAILWKIVNEWNKDEFTSYVLWREFQTNKKWMFTALRYLALSWTHLDELSDGLKPFLLMFFKTAYNSETLEDWRKKIEEFADQVPAVTFWDDNVSKTKDQDKQSPENEKSLLKVPKNAIKLWEGEIVPWVIWAAHLVSAATAAVSSEDLNIVGKTLALLKTDLWVDLQAAKEWEGWLFWDTHIQGLFTLKSWELAALLLTDENKPLTVKLWNFSWKVSTKVAWVPLWLSWWRNVVKKSVLSEEAIQSTPLFGENPIGIVRRWVQIFHESSDGSLKIYAWAGDKNQFKEWLKDINRFVMWNVAVRMDNFQMTWEVLHKDTYTNLYVTAAYEADLWNDKLAMMELEFGKVKDEMLWIDQQTLKANITWAIDLQKRWSWSVNTSSWNKVWAQLSVASNKNSGSEWSFSIASVIYFKHKKWHVGWLNFVTWNDNTYLTPNSATWELQKWAYLTVKLNPAHLQELIKKKK